MGKKGKKYLGYRIYEYVKMAFNSYVFTYYVGLTMYVRSYIRDEQIPGLSPLRAFKAT
jgi:hypothetical protein